MTTLDDHFMATALLLARRGLGRVWPNPSVGCVLVQGRCVVGRGWTQEHGQHAEANALGRAGSRAQGATAYVTFEPCCHFGRTPPCTEALIKAGVVRVVIPCVDPDPRVRGRGVEALKRAGICVDVGLRDAEARALNVGFIKRVQEGIPLLALKVASTLDGKIATEGGESQWITGQDARAYGHRLRRSFDALMVGSGTVLADNPRLTCRLSGLSSPVRVILDTHLRIPCVSHVVEGAREVSTWVLTSSHAPEDRREELGRCGVRVHTCATRDGHLDLDDVMHFLGREGLTRVLVEGGGGLMTSFIKGKWIDEMYWFHGGMIMGKGQDAVGSLEIQGLENRPSWRLKSVKCLGNDTLSIFEPA